jgi:hypothetical protein
METFMTRRILVLAPILAFSLAATLGLAGCMDASDLMKKDPVFYTTTRKTPQAYAECVADSWKRQGGDVKTRPTDAGFLVTNSDGVGINAALTVETWANGDTKVRMSVRSSFGSQDLSQAANLCS